MTCRLARRLQNGPTGNSLLKAAATDKVPYRAQGLCQNLSSCRPTWPTTLGNPESSNSQ
jgi:hypothetical protein